MSAKTLKKAFTVKLNDGNSLELAIVKPSPAQTTEAQTQSNLAFDRAMKTKAPLRAQIDEFLRERGLWDDARQAKFSELQKKILDAQLQIQKGGNVNKLKNLALEAMKLRNEIVEMSSVRNELDGNTVEGIAENARLNYLFSVCLVDNDSGEPYFKSYEDYLKSTETEVINEGLKSFYAFVFGSDTVVEDTPEQKFLKRFGFMNAKGQLINKDKKLIDDKGRLIREDGRLINEKNQLVDANGNVVDEDGNFVIDDFQGYFDDSGTRLDIEKTEVKTETLV